MPSVCLLCGSLKCAECIQPEGLAWSVEPRSWSLQETAAESAIVLAVIALFALPLAHVVAAVLILASRFEVARVITGLVVLVMALAEASLIRGLLQRVLRRWARKWSFRVRGAEPGSDKTEGAGWVSVAAGTPLRGWGSVRDGKTHYKWIADYVRGERSAHTTAVL